jgi:hypothetical protein
MAGKFVFRCFGNFACHIARILIDVAGNFSMIHVRAASCLQVALRAVSLACTVEPRAVLRTRKGIIESTPVIKAAWHLGFSGTVRAFISFRPLSDPAARREVSASELNEMLGGWTGVTIGLCIEGNQIARRHRRSDWIYQKPGYEIDFVVTGEACAKRGSG